MGEDTGGDPQPRTPRTLAQGRGGAADGLPMLLASMQV